MTNESVDIKDNLTPATKKIEAVKTTNYREYIGKFPKKMTRNKPILGLTPKLESKPDFHMMRSTSGSFSMMAQDVPPPQTSNDSLHDLSVMSK